MEIMEKEMTVWIIRTGYLRLNKAQIPLAGEREDGRLLS